MGTNTLSAVETPPKQVSKCDDNDNETAPHSGSDTLSWGLFIASGGDDQAITGCSAMITITQSEVLRLLYSSLSTIFHT